MCLCAYESRNPKSNALERKTQKKTVYNWSVITAACKLRLKRWFSLCRIFKTSEEGTLVIVLEDVLSGLIRPPKRLSEWGLAFFSFFSSFFPRLLSFSSHLCKRSYHCCSATKLSGLFTLEHQQKVLCKLGADLCIIKHLFVKSS